MSEKIISKNISIINRYSNSYADRKLIEFGLNKTKAEVMLFINDNSSPNQTEINDHFLFNKSSISKIINSLERNGYVERSSDKEDIRQKNVSLTKKGDSMIVTLKDIIDGWDKDITSTLSEDELKSFKDTLEVIATRILNKEN